MDSHGLAFQADAGHGLQTPSLADGARLSRLPTGNLFLNLAHRRPPQCRPPVAPLGAGRGSLSPSPFLAMSPSLRGSFLPRYLIATTLLSYLPFIWGHLINVTVDDTYGDPVTLVQPNYVSVVDGKWTAFDAINDTTTGCDPSSSQSCWSRPQPPQNASRGTFHLAEWNPLDNPLNTPNSRPRVEIEFTGNTIYAFGIMYNMGDSAVAGQGITSASYLSFMIDDQLVNATYAHTPNNQQTNGSYWVFNVPIYTNNSLPYGKHKLTILNGGNPSHSMFLFDYAIYTYDDSRGTPSGNGFSTGSTAPTGSPPSSSDPQGSSSNPSSDASGKPLSSTRHAGKFIGAAIGGIGVLVLAGIGGFFWWQRRKRSNEVHWYDHGEPKPSENPYLENPSPPHVRVPLTHSRSVETVDQRSERSPLNLLHTPPPSTTVGSSSRSDERSESQRDPYLATKSWTRMANQSMNYPRAPRSTTSSSAVSGSDTNVSFSPLSPASRYSDTYYPTNHTFPTPLNQMPSLEQQLRQPAPSGPARSESSMVNTRLEAQVRALALEVSLLRTERDGGTMMTRRTSLLSDFESPGHELPPTYEDHGEDDLISTR